MQDIGNEKRGEVREKMLARMLLAHLSGNSMYNTLPLAQLKKRSDDSLEMPDDNSSMVVKRNCFNTLRKNGGHWICW
ncbi:hypothetical protein SNEBB_009647 [Seison nebaliae]|nr:hypothetical protein SNEBB_009647 [Seison nebaliae]